MYNANRRQAIQFETLMKKQAVDEVKDSETLLERAIQSNRDDLIKELKALQAKVERLVAMVGVRPLGLDVKVEIEKLASILEDEKPQRQSRKAKRIKTNDKRRLMVAQLVKHDGRMTKPDLLRIAGEHFGVEPSPSFLDSAIKSTPELQCEKSDSNYSIVTFTKQSTANQRRQSDS